MQDSIAVRKLRDGGVGDAFGCCDVAGVVGGDGEGGQGAEDDALIVCPTTTSSVSLHGRANDLSLNLPDRPVIVRTRPIVQTIIDVPLSIDHAALLEPLPALFRSIEIIARLLLRPSRQMSRNVNVQLIRNRVNVSMLLVPPQTATRSRAVRFVHVVENRLCRGEICLVACYIVDGDPTNCQYEVYDSEQYDVLAYQASAHQPSSS